MPAINGKYKFKSGVLSGQCIAAETCNIEEKAKIDDHLECSTTLCICDCHDDLTDSNKELVCSVIENVKWSRFLANHRTGKNGPQ